MRLDYDLIRSMMLDIESEKEKAYSCVSSVSLALLVEFAKKAASSSIGL